VQAMQLARLRGASSPKGGIAKNSVSGHASSKLLSFDRLTQGQVSAVEIVKGSGSNVAAANDLTVMNAAVVTERPPECS
jgi:hypothetical protein